MLTGRVKLLLYTDANHATSRVQTDLLMHDVAIQTDSREEIPYESTVMLLHYY